MAGHIIYKQGHTCSSVFDDERNRRYNIRRWLDEWIRQAHLGKHKILGNGLSVIDFSDKGYRTKSVAVNADGTS